MIILVMAAALSFGLFACSEALDTPNTVEETVCDAGPHADRRTRDLV